MTAVVTGANGYIASRIIYDLLRLGYRVKGTVRDPNDQKNQFLKDMLPEYSQNLELVSIPNLLEDVGFNEAFEGCDYVIHAASPVTLVETTDPERDIILPAVNGVRFALQAALRHGAKKFVFISSLAAVCGTQRIKNPQHIWSEEDWNDEMARAYSKSKTLAEKTMWDFAKEHPEMDYISINPTVVLGPILDGKLFSTTANISNLLSGKYLEEGMPSFIAGIVDVRDVSEAVLRSLTDRDSIGKRYLLALKSNYHLLHIAQSIERSFPGEFEFNEKWKDGKAPTTMEYSINNTRVLQLLGHDLISFDQTVKDTVESFKKFNMINT